MGSKGHPSTLWEKMAQPGPVFRLPSMAPWALPLGCRPLAHPALPPAAPRRNSFSTGWQSACSPPSLPQGPLAGLLSLPGEMPGWRWRGQQAGAQGEEPWDSGPVGPLTPNSAQH